MYMFKNVLEPKNILCFLVLLNERRAQLRSPWREENQKKIKKYLWIE
jgi:hypothetical protein